MFPTLPLASAAPWYTHVALAVLALIALGLAWTCLKGILATVGRACTLAGDTLNRLWLTLTGAPLSSSGTAHFATTGEVRRSGLLTATGIPLGQWQGQVLHATGHVVLMAPPRSGKSWNTVMPCLRDWQGSVIASDLRGELWERTHEGRAQAGPTYRFSPAEQQSACINILDAIRWGTDYEHGDVHRVASHLLAATGDATSDSFRLAAVPLLVALMVDRRQAGEGSLPGIVRWMQDPERALRQKLESLLHASHPSAQAGGRQMLDLSERMQAMAWGVVSAELAVFADPLIARHTGHSDFVLDSLLAGTVPVSLYLCFTFAEVQRLTPLLSTVVEQVVALLSAADLPHRQRLLFCLDEMANLGALHDVEQAVSFLQGSGAILLAIFQNVEQVVHLYGPHSPLLASIATKVFYTPADSVTAAYIAGYLGESTIRTQATTVSTSTLLTKPSRTVATTQQERARPLMTTDEILRMDPQTALVVHQSTAPILTTKLGTPPPTPAQRLRATALAHPQGLAWALGCGLLWLALSPLWQAPPPPRVAQAGLGALALGSPTPAAPGPEAPASPLAPPPAPAAPEPSPWVLTATERTLTGALVPREQGRYASLEQCEARLQTMYGPLLEVLERMHGAGQPDPQIVRAPGQRRWQAREGATRQAYEARCTPAP